MKRRRRFLVAIVILMVLAGVGTVLGVLWYLHVAGDESVLSPKEWRRLRARFTQETEEAPVPEPASGETSAPLPATSPPQRTPMEEVDPRLLEAQWEQYRAERVKGVVELQPARRTTTLALPEGEATLINLNPNVNRWYVLELSGPGGQRTSYHLANAHPESQDLTLDPDNELGITLVNDRGKRACLLWSDAAPIPLETARLARSPYVSLCDDEVALRLATPGRRTTLEWATDFLRDNVWGGEQITVFVREKFFQDAFLDTSETVTAEDRLAEPKLRRGPRAALLAPSAEGVRLLPNELGLTVKNDSDADDTVRAGAWYELSHHPGVFASVLRPDLIAPEILRSHPQVVTPLDAVEREALVYVLAFDLERFEIGFAIGTEHPRVDWSARALDSARNPELPGPDGIGDLAPLVATGIVPRSDAHRTIATFTGGFKRDHGAFRVSKLANENHGTHYGFIESGTILSKLQPGLATIFALQGGDLRMKTWTAEDDALLTRIVFARQNGLAVIERDPASGGSVPGPKVSQWAAGNWSGSQDRSFRTVRAGAALQRTEGHSYLLYAYFSSATPSAMARVFQAYDCEYAMMLDMNALEHTYSATYHLSSDKLVVEHLIRGMEVLDKVVDGQVLPRFLGFADNRDFFYVMRREVSDDDF